MGQLGLRTIDKLEKYAKDHFNPVLYGFSSEMQVRIMIAERLFQAYESKRIPITRLPRKVIGIVAEQVYRSILTTAATDPNMARLRDEVGIKEDAHGKIIPRPYQKLTNDIEAYEVFRRMWGVSSLNHAKTVYEDGAMALIDMGIKNNSGRDLAAGLDRIRLAYNNFEESTEDRSNTASVERDFISDASLVNPHAHSFTREEIEEKKKEYGAYSDVNIEELIQQSDGSYSPDPGEADPTDDEDYFERIEREQREAKNKE